ncbi:MAG: hypothetical protein V5A24_06720 [Haloarculaceae archaeon]
MSSALYQGSNYPVLMIPPQQSVGPHYLRAGGASLGSGGNP